MFPYSHVRTRCGGVWRSFHQVSLLVSSPSLFGHLKGVVIGQLDNSRMCEGWFGAIFLPLTLGTWFPPFITFRLIDLRARESVPQHSCVGWLRFSVHFRCLGCMINLFFSGEFPPSRMISFTLPASTPSPFLLFDFFPCFRPLFHFRSPQFGVLCFHLFGLGVSGRYHITIFITLPLYPFDIFHTCLKLVHYIEPSSPGCNYMLGVPLPFVPHLSS